MGIRERAGDLTRDRHGLLHRQLLFPLQALAQRLSLDVGHDVIQQLTGGAGIVQREDVGMVQLRGDLDLAQEPLRAQGRGDLLAQHLDGDGAVMAPVTGEKHDSHPSAPELALERVAVRQGGPEALLKIAHARAKIGLPPSAG